MKYSRSLITSALIETNTLYSKEIAKTPRFRYVTLDLSDKTCLQNVLHFDFTSSLKVKKLAGSASYFHTQP